MDMTNSIADTWQCSRGVAVPGRKLEPGKVGELRLTVAKASILSLLLCVVSCAELSTLACLGRSPACAICHLPTRHRCRPSIDVHDSILLFAEQWPGGRRVDERGRNS
jgi:hypothetical protein